MGRLYRVALWGLFYRGNDMMMISLREIFLREIYSENPLMVFRETLMTLGEILMAFRESS
jgi:hypothetical protein